MAKKIDLFYNKECEATAIITSDSGRTGLAESLRRMCAAAQVSKIPFGVEVTDLTVSEYNRAIKHLEAERDELVRKLHASIDKRQLKLFTI